MIDPPHVTATAARITAFIHVTIPRQGISTQEVQELAPPELCSQSYPANRGSQCVTQSKDPGGCLLRERLLFPAPAHPLQHA